MKTDVYFATRERGMIIAYLNEKQQEVFLSISRYNFAPYLQNTLFLNNSIKIEDVLEKGFEYTIINKKEIDVGVKFANIWKPFMQEHLLAELNFDIPTLYRAKRNLSILIQKLQEILLFIEPSSKCLQTYSHKIKELLILSCTELENSFKFYNIGKNERTSDYVQLLKFVDLSKYKISLIGYEDAYKGCPFEFWTSENPTKSIPWYYAYTQIKHNSDKYFSLATLENCINAIMANIIMFVIRYSAKYLYKENDVCSNLIGTHFDFRIENSLDFYIPLMESTLIYPYSEQPYYFTNDMVATELVGRIKQLPFEEREMK